MGTEQQHKDKADSNARFFQAIRPLGFPDWSATVVFYEAVHLVEAILSRKGIHSKTHWERKAIVRSNLAGIWSQYSLLENYSRWARYGFKKINDGRDIPKLLTALQDIKAAAGPPNP